MKHRLRAILVSFLIFAVAACAPRTRAGATATVVGGVALAVAGSVMLAGLQGPGADTNGNGVDEFPDKEVECALGGCLIAYALIATGVGMGISGLIGLSAEENKPPSVPMPTSAHAEVQQLDTHILAPLPELPCDEHSLELAKQARNLAHDGHCEVALQLAQDIAQKDAAYADALMKSSALARCVPQPATAISGSN